MSAADVQVWREKMRRERAGHHGINAYQCPACGRNTVTIDVDPGVTPMFLTCRRTEGCTGMAVSSGYPEDEPPQHILDHLVWEWALPDASEYASLDAATRDHVDAGGLVLRPRTDRRSAYLTAEAGAR